MAFADLIRDKKIPREHAVQAWKYWKYYQMPKDYKLAHKKEYEELRMIVSQSFIVKIVTLWKERGNERLDLRIRILQ